MAEEDLVMQVITKGFEASDDVQPGSEEYKQILDTVNKVYSNRIAETKVNIEYEIEERKLENEEKFKEESFELQREELKLREKELEIRTSEMLNKQREIEAQIRKLDNELVIHNDDMLIKKMQTKVDWGKIAIPAGVTLIGTGCWVFFTGKSFKMNYKFNGIPDKELGKLLNMVNPFKKN